MRILTATLTLVLLTCLFAPSLCEQEASPLNPSPPNHGFEMEVPESHVDPSMMDDIQITPNELTEEEMLEAGMNGFEGTQRRRASSHKQEERRKKKSIW